MLCRDRFSELEKKVVLPFTLGKEKGIWLVMHVQDGVSKRSKK